MSPRLEISEYVIERLSKVEGTTGCLYGLMYDGTLLVLGFSLELQEEECQQSQIQLNFPTEVELCGVVKFSNSLITENSLKAILQNVDITDNPLAIMVNDAREVKAHFLIHDRFEKTNFTTVTKEALWKQFLHIQLKTVLPLHCEAEQNNVKDALQAKRKKIASGQVAFHISNTTVYLVGTEVDTGMINSSEPTIGEILESASAEPPNKKKKAYASEIEIVPVNIIMKATRESQSEKLLKTAVKMVTTQGKPAYCISLPLTLDALVLTHRSALRTQLYSSMVEAACRSLRLLEENLVNQLEQEGIGDGAGLRLPETFHFLPENCGHFFTRIIPKGLTDDNDENLRLILHKQLGLALDRPIFRRGNSHIFQGPAGQPLLLNPHEAISTPGDKTDTVTAVVRGRYAYHHYMQDKFNDDGWGCAYRSLQTLCSWFRLQGYTNEPVPTHYQIQQCLVNINDKPRSFLGSKQWIGSTEVSFCLETLLGIQSRIIFANNGTELQSYGPELIHHFQKHGSPIMIGGGVLAHTILGVEYNTVTKVIKYLILDPHYTGIEDLNVIINKGWCGWKNSDFWNKADHYNLCLPQTTPCI